MKMEDMKGWTMDVVDHLLSQAVTFRKKGDEIPPTFFLVSFPENETPLVYQVDPSNWGNDKEGVAQQIRVQSEEVGARYVIHLCEAWMSIPSNEEALAAGAWINAGMSLASYPDKTENILLSVDGPDLNQILMHRIHDDGSIGERMNVEGEYGGNFHNLSGHVGCN